MATSSSRAQSSSVRASGATSEAPTTAPRNTSPVSPSIVITSPAASVRPGKRTVPSPTSTSRAPTTAGRPQPRATTAAWLARPPRLVRIPAARAMPCTSSGDVSPRTRIGVRPSSAARWAASGFVTISPVATPGDAASPVARGRASRWHAGRDARRVRQDRRDPHHGLAAREREVLVEGHLERHPQRGPRASLADAHLEEPQAAVLDGELDVAQVAVVDLQSWRRPGAARRRPRAAVRRGSPTAPFDACRPRRPRPARRTSRRRTGPPRRSPGCG